MSINQIESMGMAGVGCRRRLWLLCASLFVSSVNAGQLDVPDSVRPGAVRPEETGKPVVPAPPPAKLFEVPAVIDRPFEIDEGPRVMVDRFRLIDARDLPGSGIALKELHQLLETLRLSRQEGFTIGQLQIVADEVTQYYRGKGLILARAVVPVQTVRSGIVDIQIFEGKLGRVLAEGNEIYSQHMLSKPFKKLIGQPVTKAGIESALLTLADYPGLSVFGVFQPGQQVGTADILLNVQEEKRFDTAFRFDNHGQRETGRFRFRPSVEWNNITGGADRLALTIQMAYRPRNNDFIAIDYDRYLGYGFKTGVFLNRNRFDVGGDLAARQIFGQTESIGAYLDKSWIRGRQLNLSSRLVFTRKESRTKVRDNISNLDRLSVFTLETNFDNVNIGTRGINFATVEFSRGVEDLFGAMGSSADALMKPAGRRPSRQGGPPGQRFASGKFTKLFATVSRLQTLTRDMTLLLRGEYQWSDDILVPLEQYAVGGPDNVRAYPQAQQLLDRAGFFSVELIHNMPFITDVPAFRSRTWGELVQLSLFYDHAIGNLNEPLTSEPRGHISFKGAGVQARFALPGVLASRLMFAWELGSIEAENERSPQIWIDITYRF